MSAIGSARPLVRARDAAPWPRDALRRAWRRSAIDRLLALGADPASGTAVARRAAALERPRTRRRLAAALRSAVRSAERGRGLSAAAPLQRAEVHAARAELLSLATALAGAPAPRARGVALAQRLVTTPESPLHAPSPPGALARAAAEASAALAAPPAG